MLKKISYLIIVIFLLYGISLSLFSNKGFPVDFKHGNFMPYLSDKPVGEDGFYMLTVAWNIQQNHEIAYNYHQLTSGIQPLSTFLYAALAFIVKTIGGDKWSLIRAVIILNLLLQVLLSYLLFKIAGKISIKKKFILPLVIIFTILNFTLFKLFTYGLETGLYLNLICIAVLYSLNAFSQASVSFKKFTVLSILFALTCLARLDFGLAVLSINIILLIKKKLNISGFIYILFLTALFTSPWFIYIHSVTGTFIPSSGPAQAMFVNSLDDFLSRVFLIINAVSDHSVPFLYTANRIVGGAVCLLIACTFILYSSRKKIFSKANFNSNSGILIFWLIAFLPFTLFYGLTSTAIHFYIRYIAPLAVIFIPVAASAVNALIENSGRYKFKFSIIILLFLISFFGYSFYFYHTGITGWSRSVSAGYLQNEHFKNKKIGAFQSGVTGYFNENVVNLDGKIDYSALKYIKQNEIDKYIEQQKIDVISDWQMYINFINPQYLKSNWKQLENTPPDSSLYFIKK